MNVLRAEAYLSRIADNTPLSEVYDEDDMLRPALTTLFPGFEYPDFAHKTLRQIWEQYRKAPQPLT